MLLHNIGNVQEASKWNYFVYDRTRKASDITVIRAILATVLFVCSIHTVKLFIKHNDKEKHYDL
jgi:hypothetical protein